MTSILGKLSTSRRAFMTGAGALALAGAASRVGAQSAADRLVVYSTTFPAVQNQLAAAFAERTGIEVQSLRLATGPLAQRFIAEQQAGQYLCDVITLGHDIFFDQISEQGLLADIDDIPGVASLPVDWRPGARFVTILIAPHSIGYNTDLVTGDSIPTTWEDLLKPQFRGQILLADPRANEPILLFLHTLRQGLGDEFLRGLADQEIRYVPAIPQGVEEVIAGDAQLYLPALSMNLIQYQNTDAPIAIIPAPAPTNGTYFFSGIAANAPNSEGARQWYEFLLSPEGQEILCRDNGVSPLGEIPGSLRMPSQLVHPSLAEVRQAAGEIYDLLRIPA